MEGLVEALEMALLHYQIEVEEEKLQMKGSDIYEQS